MATTGPARRARVTHSAVASAGMRSAGPSVRSPWPEQLTRQAAPGAGPQRQGGAHGPQPRPGTPASAPSHRPRPKASARRAGAAGGIVRAAQAWPRPAPEGPSAPGPGGRGSGGAPTRHGSQRGCVRRRPRPVCLRDSLSALGTGRVPRCPLALWRCSAARPPAPPPPGAARGGAPGGSAPRGGSGRWAVLGGLGVLSCSLAPGRTPGPRLCSLLSRSAGRCSRLSLGSTRRVRLPAVSTPEESQQN